MTLRRMLIAACMVLGAGADALHGETSATQPATTQSTLPPAFSKPANDFFTLEQLVQAYRDKQHQVVIQQSARLLTNPKAAGTFDRFSVLVLRAESFLQIRNFSAAIEGFKAAAKEAPNEDKRAVIGATAILIVKRTGTAYVPRTTDEHGNPLPARDAHGKHAASIDLLDLSQRESAFRALFWDELDGFQKQVPKVKTLSSLQQGMEAWKALTMLERVAGGQDTETRRLREQLAVVAEAALSSEVEDKTSEIKGVFQRARQTETVQRERTMRSGTTRLDQVEQQKGLDTGEVERLNRAIKFLGKVPATVDVIVEELKADRKAFDPVIKRAEEVKKETRELMDDYSQRGLLR